MCEQKLLAPPGSSNATIDPATVRAIKALGLQDDVKAILEVTVLQGAWCSD